MTHLRIAVTENSRKLKRYWSTRMAASCREASLPVLGAGQLHTVGIPHNCTVYVHSRRFNLTQARGNDSKVSIHYIRDGIRLRKYNEEWIKKNIPSYH